MGKVIYYDTETNDKWDFKASADADHQPYIVQLAGVLEEDGEVETTFYEYVQLPEGVSISPGAANVHGIDMKVLEDYGRPPHDVLSAFYQLASTADVMVAHNEDFDRRVVSRNLQRFLPRLSIHPIPAYCTMKAATPICKLPGKYGSNYKWPQLNEAYGMLVDPQGFSGAHDALTDVWACRKLYHVLQTMGA